MAILSATSDHHFMRMALMMGRRGLGQVAPNPSVGCVLVKDGHVVGRGTTQPGGRPHAEVAAIAAAQDRFGPNVTKGATAYVTLEPCAHQGKSPPCTSALIAAGVTRVVSAMEDPNPAVAGQGHTQLEAAGMTVTTGVLAQDAQRSHAGFLTVLEHDRPMVMLKFGTSLDGRIATHTGQSQWITGSAARARAHLMRARFDGILVGLGTALADDPSLTCRLPGLEGRSPTRIVLDSHLRLPLTANLVRTASDVRTIILTREGAEKARRKAFEKAGVEVVGIPVPKAGAEGVPLDAALEQLALRGISRLLVEGGSQVAGSLLALGLVDMISWFRAGGVIGGDGLPAIEAFGIDKLVNMPRYQLSRQEKLGEDLLDIWVKQP
ncbi:MAG: bifunctional diaminohydroxyphosphoribosylaminopyrimidine deaminase/5-amino-6-(5-phosphoribosylamino)uracil reductase RibD [Alphaproteobacteria bacterium]